MRRRLSALCLNGACVCHVCHVCLAEATARSEECSPDFPCYYRADGHGRSSCLRPSKRAYRTQKKNISPSLERPRRADASGCWTGIWLAPGPAGRPAGPIGPVPKTVHKILQSQADMAVSPATCGVACMCEVFRPVMPLRCPLLSSNGLLTIT